MAYRNTFFRWLFLYSLTFGLTYVLKLFTYLCPETGQKRGMTVSWSSVKKQENRGSLDTSRKALMASRAGSRNFCDSESQKLPRFSCFFTLLQLTAIPRFQTPLCPLPKAPPPPKTSRSP